MSSQAIGVTVRTPAGTGSAFAIDGDTTARHLIERAVEHFVAYDQLEPGTFRIGLLRGREIVDLDPDNRPLAVGVEEGDVLHLLTCEPQVDGTYTELVLFA